MQRCRDAKQDLLLQQMPLAVKHPIFDCCLWAKPFYFAFAFINVIRLHQAYSQDSCTFLLSCCTKYISGFLFTFGEHLNICHWILKEREGSSPAPTWNYASRVFQIVLLRSLPLVPSLHNIISGLRFWITLSFQCSCQRDQCPRTQPARKQMQIIG